MKGPYDISWAQWGVALGIGCMVAIVIIMVGVNVQDRRARAIRARMLREDTKACGCANPLCKRFGCPKSQHWTGDMDLDA